MLIIEPGRINSNYWRDLLSYRELLYFLAWRDVLVRYKQTIVGIGWVLLRPIVTLIIFIFIFEKIAGLSSGGIPYAPFVFAGLLPWQLFCSILTDASNSLMTNAGMLSKVYFPRLIVPLSSVVVSVLDFLVTCFLMAVLMLFYEIKPSLNLIFFPIFVFVAIAASFGLGLWFAALNIKYRDFRFIVPFAIQIGLYVSPIGFDAALVPEKWRLIYSLNPIVGVIEGVRWSLFGGDMQIYWPGFFLSLCLVFVLLISGLWFFRKTEKLFADII